MFNALTGSNQYVGNWPGVTVEKKEGKLKKRDDVIITDLPGIYSLSPYTLEEVVARDYLIVERPNAILNIVDGTNLERNLYLSTQLAELGIPVVIAINMMDVVRKNGDKIDLAELSRQLGCRVVEISALKNEGVNEAVDAAIEASKEGIKLPQHIFSGAVEHALAHIEEAVLHSMNEEQQRWYAIKIFERDEKVLKQLNIPEETMKHIEKDIEAAEKELDDEADSIITNERYVYITAVTQACYKKKDKDRLSTSDKIDNVVTSRIFGLPVFALIMFLVYFLSMAPISPGAMLSDWANNGLFGEGWHLLGIGAHDYKIAAEEYKNASYVIDAFTGCKDADLETITAAYMETDNSAVANYLIEDDETLATEEVIYTHADLIKAAAVYEKNNCEEPEPDSFGIWVPSIPMLVEGLLDKLNCADWLKGLILEGIIGGVGSVLGFVPQLLILFFLLAFLEACGYMSRIAFVLDRLFRKFGLSGKSFIPILVGTGCGVPGVMASRTIENEKDRRMTIMTTTFIPCGAKVPFIAMIAGALFKGSPLISVGAYCIGMAAIILSGIMLKKTKMFQGEESPFVMELPQYHMPTLANLLRSMWDRGWSFIKKAGTVILLSTMVIWFLSNFGVVGGAFKMVSEEEMNYSILARFGSLISWIFIPLGWGNWHATVASLTGLVAKENIVGTMGVLCSTGEGTVYQALALEFTKLSGFSFLVFNLLCAPCIAAISAIAREMNSFKWTLFAIGWQCGFAYAISLMIYQFGNALTGNVNVIGLIASFIVLLIMIYMLFIKKKAGKKE
ncbi:MAG: ferrous iron transporter B [Lachnospiraceae bacterium]|nr:ferrous iron transporter B [Lachnospiraceae bacterium]